MERGFVRSAAQVVGWLDKEQLGGAEGFVAE